MKITCAHTTWYACTEKLDVKVMLACTHEKVKAEACGVASNSPVPREPNPVFGWVWAQDRWPRCTGRGKR